MAVHRSLAALFLVMAVSVSNAHGADTAQVMRQMDGGDCGSAGDSINEALGRKDPEAYLLAGYLYSSSPCVEEDLPRAAGFYQRAIERGNLQARTLLGFMYGMGHGVPQDYRVANRWYTYEADPAKRPADGDSAIELANGYARTVTQLARSKVRYPSSSADSNQGTVYVTFHTAGGPVTFASQSVNKDANRTTRIPQPTLFTNAIADAYADAVRWAPKPVGLPSRDVVYEVPWTFELK